MKKKGFTLIEIIICIALIAVIGTVSVVSVNKAMSVKGEAKILEKNEPNFRDALEVYLSTHTEVLENVNDNVKAAVVSLELLKNEGLISEDLGIDYKNNYFTLTNAVLLEDTEDLSDVELKDVCANQIEIKTFASWELNDDATEVVYVCPREGDGGDGGEGDLTELKERLENLETAISLIDLGNNNWVLFDVNSQTDKMVSWPDNNNQDKWSIINTNVSSKQLKLLYSQNLVTDNSKSFGNSEIQYATEDFCDSFYSRNSFSSRYQLELDKSKVKYWDMSKNSYSGYESYDLIMEYEGKSYIVDIYEGKKCHRVNEISINTNSIYRKNSAYENLIRYENNEQWSLDEMVTQKYDTENSKKKLLYDNINDDLKSHILNTNNYYEYKERTSYAGGDDLVLNTSKKYNDKFGLISKDDNALDPSFVVGRNNFFAGMYWYTKLVSPRVRYFYGYLYMNSSLALAQYVKISLYDNTDEYWENASEHYKLTDPTELIGGEGLYVYTFNYIPVITINFKKLLDNIEDYPQQYRTEYPDCDNSNLGSNLCPKIIQFSDGTLSWGN